MRLRQIFLLCLLCLAAVYMAHAALDLQRYIGAAITLWKQRGEPQTSQLTQSNFLNSTYFDRVRAQQEENQKKVEQQKSEIEAAFQAGTLSRIHVLTTPTRTALNTAFEEWQHKNPEMEIVSLHFTVSLGSQELTIVYKKKKLSQEHIPSQM